MSPIRIAEANDLPKLASIERSAASVFATVGLGWLANGDAMDPGALLAMYREKTLWVATAEDERLAGFLAGHKLDASFHIAEVSVARPYQGRGLGAALVVAAAGHAKSEGFRTLTLTTYRDLPWNAPFYARLGFREVQPTAVQPGHTAKLKAEADAGHDPTRRCLMEKML